MSKRTWMNTIKSKLHVLFLPKKTTKEVQKMPKENTNCHLCGTKLKKKQYSFDDGISTFHGCICKKCEVTYLFLSGELVEGEAYKKYIDHMNQEREIEATEKKIKQLNSYTLNVSDYPLSDASKFEQRRVSALLKTTPEVLKREYENGTLSIKQVLLLSKYTARSIDSMFKLVREDSKDNSESEEEILLPETAAYEESL